MMFWSIEKSDWGFEVENVTEIYIKAILIFFQCMYNKSNLTSLVCIHRRPPCNIDCKPIDLWKKNPWLQKSNKKYQNQT